MASRGEADGEGDEGGVMGLFLFIGMAVTMGLILTALLMNGMQQRTFQRNRDDLVLYRTAKQDDTSIQDPSPFSCPQDWVVVNENAYFYSNVPRSWIFSQIYCAACGSSLLVIENKLEKVNVMKNRNHIKYWIALRREKEDAKWKRINGSEYSDNWDPIEGDGLCALLNDRQMSSKECNNVHYFICKKHQHNF